MTMATTEQEPKGSQEEKYIEFPCLPADATRDGKPALNRHSQHITKGHDFPGAQVRQSPRIMHIIFSLDLSQPC